MRATMLVCWAAAALSACTDEPDTQAEVERIEAVAHGLMAADNARDADRVAQLYASDAVMMPLAESPVEGIAAIRPRYEAFFETHQPDLRFLIEETVVDGELAFVRGRTRGSIRDLTDGTEQNISDMFLMILRRSEAGRWHISRLMWHADADGG